MCEISSQLSTNTGFCKAVLPQKDALLSPLTFAHVFKLKNYRKMKKMYCSFMLVALVFASSCKKKDTPPEITGKYGIVAADSKLEWKGYKNGGGHHGAFTVAPADITVLQGKLAGVTFTVDITTIQDFDLSVEEGRDELLDHLQSDAFFNVALHPTATFTITSQAPYEGGTEGAIAGANCIIKGNFTMLGKTLAISFPAKVNVTGTSLLAEATFKIDRTKWGMNSFSDPAGGLYVFPNVDIILKIKADK